MKFKLSLIVIGAFLLAASSAPVFGQGAGQQQRTQDPAVHGNIAVVAPENQVQVQNQIQTQNQGAESQLQVATQQMEEFMAMEEWGEAVGNQVRAVVQEQAQAQAQIQQELVSMAARSGFMKKLFGPDYKAIKNLKQQMEQNQLRIQQLEQMQNQVQNQADATQLQLVTQALASQNTVLQQQVQAEEKVGSVFGWLIKLFN